VRSRADGRCAFAPRPLLWAAMMQGSGNSWPCLAAPVPAVMCLAALCLHVQADLHRDWRLQAQVGTECRC